MIKEMGKNLKENKKSMSMTDEEVFEMEDKFIETVTEVSMGSMMERATKLR